MEKYITVICLIFSISIIALGTGLVKPFIGATAAGGVVATDLNEIQDVVNTNAANSAGSFAVVESKLVEAVSVKKYGAVGDGVTDDYSAVQAALDLGGTVFFPSGTYLVETQLRIKSNTILDLKSGATIKGRAKFRL